MLQATVLWDTVSVTTTGAEAGVSNIMFELAISLAWICIFTELLPEFSTITVFACDVFLYNVHIVFAEVNPFTSSVILLLEFTTFFTEAISSERKITLYPLSVPSRITVFNKLSFAKTDVIDINNTVNNKNNLSIFLSSPLIYLHYKNILLFW